MVVSIQMINQMDHLNARLGAEKLMAVEEQNHIQPENTQCKGCAAAADANALTANLPRTE